MKRIEYEQPSVEVVELQQRQQLLAGSAGLNDYTWNNESEEARQTDLNE